MAFKYRGRTAEDVSRRAKQSGGSFDSWINPDIPTFKPREGENRVRILPATWGDPSKYPEAKDDPEVQQWGTGWEIAVHLHNNIGPDNATYLCLNKMQAKVCPACEARNQAADEDEKDALRVNWRAVCYVIDRENERAGPQVWGLPITLFRDINARSQDKKTGKPILIDDPEEGFDLAFDREGTGIRTKYVRLDVDRDPTPIHDDEKIQDRWMAFVEENPLPDVLNYYEADYIEKILYGKASARRDDGDGARSRGRNSGREREGRDDDRGPRRRGGRDEGHVDEAEDTRGRGRRSGRDEEEVERGSTRRGRGVESDQEDRGGRRGSRVARDDDEVEDTRGDRGRGRGEPEGDEREGSPREGSRGRGEGAEPEGTRAASRGRGRGQEEPPEDERPSRRRLAGSERGDERGGSRRGGRDSERGDDAPSRSGREQVERLRSRRG